MVEAYESYTRYAVSRDYCHPLKIFTTLEIDVGELHVLGLRQHVLPANLSAILTANRLDGLEAAKFDFCYSRLSIHFPSLRASSLTNISMSSCMAC